MKLLFLHIYDSADRADLSKGRPPICSETTSSALSTAESPGMSPPSESCQFILNLL